MTQDVKTLSESSASVEGANQTDALPHSSWQRIPSAPLPPIPSRRAAVASEPAPKVRPFSLGFALLVATLGLGASLYAIAAPRWTSRFPSGAAMTFLEHLSLVRMLLVGSVSGAVLVAGGLVAFLSLALYIVNELIRPQRSTPFVPLTPFALGLPGENVHFPASDGGHQVTGLFIPRAGATTMVVVSPGYRRTYSDVLGMCKHLWEAGHNVLAFEYYGHGGGAGRIPITLGYRETHDFLGAVAYAKKRAPDTRLGALGYSMGAAVSLMGSAQTREVEAVVADSAFATHWSAVEVAVHRTLRVSKWWPRFLLRLLHWLADQVLWVRAGYRFQHVEPVREIAKLAGRPVLLIHGLEDTIVDPHDAHLLYEAAAKPKALWMIPEAEHIKGYFSDSEAYVARVTAFFDRHLTRAVDTTPIARDVVSHKLTVVPAREQNAQSVPETAPLRPKGKDKRKKGNADATSARPSLGALYGQLVYRWRWSIVALWGVVICLSIPFASHLSSVLHNSGYAISSSESSAVDAQLVSTLHRPATQVLVVFQSQNVPVIDPAYQREVADFVARARGFSHVAAITQGGVGRDGRSTFVAVGINQDKDSLAERIPDFRKLLPHAGPARAYLTGDSAAASEVQLDTQADTEFAETLAMPLTLLVLFIVFGSVVAGGMPLLLAGVAVPTALAAIYAIALYLPTNIFVLNVASIIGLGLSIDYSLLIVRRFREELAQGRSVQDAVATTVTTAGEAILFSGMTVAIGFAGLLFIGISVMTSFGIGGVATAAACVLSALTLLPALLSIIGARVNALRIPLLPRLADVFSGRGSHQGEHSFWRRWAIMIMRKPILVVVLVSVILILLGLPARTLNPGNPGASSLPAGSEARAGLDLLHAQFPAVNDDPVYMLVHTQTGSGMLIAQNIQHVDRLSRWLATQSHITSVESLTSLPPEPGIQPALTIEQLTQLYSSGAYQRNPGLQALVRSTTAKDTTLIVLHTNTQEGTSADEGLIDRLRSIDPQVKEGLSTQIGGARVVNLDFNRTLYANFIRALAFILLATYVLLLVTFRSVLLPFKAIVMNVLSISASYGALVFIFQEGHFQQFLGFSTNGTIDRFIPIILFCILFGLSMDYEVFLLSRIREEACTWDNQTAVALGLEKTGGVITNAALLFAIVSSAFIATTLIVTKELGVGITVSILVDASIIRCMLVPASMQLLGRWNWWFPGQKRTAFRAASPRLALPPSPAELSRGTVVSAQHNTRGGRTQAALQLAQVEHELMQLFARTLAIPREQVQATSDFFQLGGDSDTLERLLSSIEQHLRVRLTPVDLFTHPVVFRLAATVVRKHQALASSKRQRRRIS